MTKVNMIMLQGQGDTHIKLVDDETFLWVCDGGDPTDAMVQAHFDYELKEHTAAPTYWPAPDLEKIRETMTSFKDDDNDRALYISGAIYDSYGGSMKDLMAFLAAEGMEIDGEYEGYIY